MTDREPDATTTRGRARDHKRGPFGAVMLGTVSGAVYSNLRVGAARVDVTPKPGWSLAGFSIGGPIATRVKDGEELHATAIYACDEAGSELVFCAMDLFSGTRALWDLVAREALIPRERILLLGSHTHTGPGQMFGSMYDLIAQDGSYYRSSLAERTAARVAAAIRAAKQSAEAGRLGIHVGDVWGLGSNQSLPAFRASASSRTWHEPGHPGHGAPDHLSPVERATDPRLWAISAWVSGQLRGLIGVFGVHSTALGEHGIDYYSPDWPGPAARKARARAIARGLADRRLVVGICASCAGDVGPLPLQATESQRPSRQGPDLQRFIGEAVGKSLFDVARAAADAPATPGEFAVAHELWELDPTGCPERLAPWALGTPAMGGSEDGRSFLSGLPWARESYQSHDFEPASPQFPKAAIWPRLASALHPPDRWPLHVVRIGRHTLLSVPGEPTLLAGWQLARTVGERLERNTAADLRAHFLVLGYANEYAGYFTTTPEFEQQQYEGASTLFGKYQVDLLAERLAELAQHPTVPTDTEPEPLFLHENMFCFWGFWHWRVVRWLLSRFRD